MNDKTINYDNMPVICLYNDGSLLREEEMSFETLLGYKRIRRKN